MYHRNLFGRNSAQYRRATPLVINSAGKEATFISSAIPFSANLERGHTYYLDAECDGYMGRWGSVKIFLQTSDGADASTSGAPGVFIPKNSGTYYVKVSVPAGVASISVWDFQIKECAHRTAYTPPPEAVDAGAGEFKLFSSSGGAIGIFPLLESAVRKTELMGSDTVTLQWDDECADDEDVLSVPLGAYAVFDGIKFRCIAPYTPQQSDELTWHYELELHSPMSALTTKPFFFYMEDLCETEFNINGEFREFTDALAKAILKSTGETWSVSAPSDLGTRSMSFSQQSIFDAVGDIAEEFGCEWKWTDKAIVFVKSVTGSDARTLTVGEDVQPPSDNGANGDYFNRYYAFGSTRNIVRSDYSSLNASVTSLAEARLKLPASDWVDEDGNTVKGCAGGYVDYNDGAGVTATERNACVKVYDDIYPQSDLVVSEVKKTVKKTDEGEEYPVYGLYLKSKATGGMFALNKSTYNKDSNPTGQLISGLNVSVNFTSGLLQGKEFELNADASNANKTLFTIVPDTSEEIMTPNELIVPKVGDSCILFNIRMPDSYRVEAEKRLYKKLLEDIEAAHNQYAAVSLTSYPTAGIQGMEVGDRVVIRNGRQSVTTRIVSLEACLDLPTQWTITTGDAVRTSKVRAMTESVEQLSGAAASASKSATLANRAAWKASQELLDQVFDPEGSFFTERIKPLVVETANVTVGTKSQQFVIDNLLFGFDNGTASKTSPFFFAKARDSAITPSLHHYAIDPDNVRTWRLNKSYTVAYGGSTSALGASFSFSSETEGCYIYAVCPRFTGADPATELNGSVLLTDRQILAEPAEDKANYYFLLGMLSSEITTDGFISRNVTLTFGETTINGGTITSGVIKAANGGVTIDLDNGEISGNIRLSASQDNKSYIDGLLGYSSTTKSLTETANAAKDTASAASSAASSAQATANAANAAASSANSTANAAKDKVDNISVGGRNYAPNSTCNLGTTKYWSFVKIDGTYLGQNVVSNANTTGWGNLKIDSIASAATLKGQKCVMSAWVKATGTDGTYPTLRADNQGQGQIILTPVYDGAWHYIAKEFTMFDDWSSTLNLILRVNNTSESVSISQFKLELGTLPTSWTPAPEDVDSAITAAANAAVKDIDVMYALGTSSTTPPTSGWQTTAPAWQDGKYMWQRTDITTGDGNKTTGTPTCIQGAAGKAGADGVGIRSIQEQYYLSTSSTSQTGGSWQTTQPAWASGKYIWTRSLITWNDGTTAYATATLSTLFNIANETANTAKSTADTAKSTADSAKNAIDNFATGTRNLVLGSQKGRKLSVYDANQIYTWALTDGMANMTFADTYHYAWLSYYVDGWTESYAPTVGGWNLGSTSSETSGWQWWNGGAQLAQGFFQVSATTRRYWFKARSAGYKLLRFALYTNATQNPTVKPTIYNVMLSIGSALADYSPAPEETDYLREALTEAAGASTEVTGGLILSRAMSVKDASGVMVAGLNGTDSAKAGQLPMIWAGAKGNTTEQMRAAAFRVYDGGHVDMTDVSIVSKAGSGSVSIGGGTVSLSDGGANQMNLRPEAMGGIATALGKAGGTEVDYAASSTQTKDGAGSFTASGRIGVTGLQSPVTMTASETKDLFTSSFLGKLTVTTDSFSPSHTLTATAADGTVGFQNGTTKSVAASKFSVAYSLSASSHAVTVLEDGAALQKDGNGAYNIKRGKKYTVKIEQTVEYRPVPSCSFSDYTTSNPAVSWNFPYTQTGAVKGAVSLKFHFKPEEYNNNYYADGFLLSKTATQYASLCSADSTVMQMRTGNAIIKLTVNGLLQSLNGSTFHRLNPLVMIIKVTYTKAVGKITSQEAIYNPLNKAIGTVSIKSQGYYSIPHNLGIAKHTLIGTAHGYEGTYNLYVSTISIGANTDEVKAADDSTPNHISEIWLHFYDYNTY